MERRREEKLQRDQEANQQAIERRKQELDKQQRKDESRKRYLENQKKKLELKKQQEQDELKAKTEAEEKKRREEGDKIAMEKKKFMKDQKSKLRKEFEEKVKEREAIKNLETEIEYEKEIKKKRIMDNMVNYLKMHKDDKEVEAQQRKDINDFYKQNEQIYSENDLSLNKIFKHYSVQNAKTIDDKLQNNVNTIDMQEFNKFGTNTKLVPSLLTNETLLNIFRTLAKERMEIAGKDDELGLVLDYESFKKSLIYIAIEGRDILGGALKPKQEEEEKYNSRYQLNTRNKSRERSESDSPPQKGVPKTIESKKLKELASKKPKYETQIKDIKIGKSFDVFSISPETLESLILFITSTK